MRRRKANGSCLLYVLLFVVIGGSIELAIEHWYIIIPIIGLIVFLIVKKKKREDRIRRTRYGSINIDSFDGLGFEHFCAQLLIDSGYNAKVTKASGDHGIDVIASKGGYTYAIQVKHYSNKVGNKAIQEAYSGRAIYGCNYAVVMTNNYFTKPAMEDARRLGVVLWNRDYVLSLMRAIAIREMEKEDYSVSKNNKAKGTNQSTISNEYEDEEDYDDGFPSSYDRERGVYLEDLYIVGEDLPKGRYRVSRMNKNDTGEIQIYDSEEDYDDDIGRVVKVEETYPLEVAKDGMYLLLINTEMKLVREL